MSELVSTHPLPTHVMLICEQLGTIQIIKLYATMPLHVENQFVKVELSYLPSLIASIVVEI